MLLRGLCVARKRSRRVDHSSRGVIPSVRVCVMSVVRTGDRLLHLQWVGRRVRLRKKERKEGTKITTMVLLRTAWRSCNVACNVACNLDKWFKNCKSQDVDTHTHTHTHIYTTVGPEKLILPQKSKVCKKVTSKENCRLVMREFMLFLSEQNNELIFYSCFILDKKNVDLIRRNQLDQCEDVSHRF
jgi:hypothetical protein